MNRVRIPDFIIQELPRRLEEEPESGWFRRILYFGPTALVDELCVHYGVLSSYVTPHPPHRHDHEEIHIALSDTLEHVSPGADAVTECTGKLEKGSLVFTDSELPHTFRNAGSEPAAYLHVRWKQNSPFAGGTPGLRVYYPDALRRSAYCGTWDEWGERIEIHSGPTRYLFRLTVRFFTLNAGCSIPLHRHGHEVLFALVSGFVEILGKSLNAPGVAFMGRHTPHYIVNHGPETAKLYAIEFHHS